MRIILLDHNLEMTIWWNQEFADTDVECICDEFTSFMKQCGDEIEAVVSPANSYGVLSGGFDLALKQHFGEPLQNAVQKHIREHYLGEQPVGSSFLIPIPDAAGKFLIHTPTMRVPGKIHDWKIVYHAMRLSLLEALRHQVRSIVIPAFGGNCGGVPRNVLAQMMRMAYDHVFSSAPEALPWGFAGGKTPEELCPVLPEKSSEWVNP